MASASVSDVAVSQKQSRAFEQEFDLVIVGGGIVGCALALAASRAAVFINPSSGVKRSSRSSSLRSSRQSSFKDSPSQLKIALIEASEQLPARVDVLNTDDDKKIVAHYDPRVVALSHESKHFLTQLGVWSLIEEQGACFYQSMEVWDAEGTGNIRFDAEELRKDSLGCIVENRTVISALYKKLEQQTNVEILRGTKVQAMNFVDDNLEQSASRELNEIFTDQNQCIKSPLVIAADGAQSKLREMAGIDTREWSYKQSAIVCTVKTEKEHKSTAWQRFTQHGPLAFLPLHSLSGELGNHNYSSIVWSLDTAIAEEKILLDDKAFCAELSQAFEYRLGKVELVSTRYTFPLVQCHAKTYFKSGIIMVGDAAHSIHPLAGQGVNLGLSDARVLADEIVRAGARGFSVSDSSIAKRYQRQRQPHNMSAMTAMEFFKRLYGSDNLVLRYLRNRCMSFCDGQSGLKNILAKLAMGSDDGLRSFEMNKNE